MQNRVQFVLLGIIIVIATLHYLGLTYDWYHTVPWFDVPLHLLGGAFIGTLFVYIFALRHVVLKTLPLVPFVILGVGFVALVGVLWEFYEFWMDVFVLKIYQPLAYPGYVHFDTLKDLFNDLVGGALAVGLLWRAVRKNE